MPFNPVENDKSEQIKLYKLMNVNMDPFLKNRIKWNVYKLLLMPCFFLSMALREYNSAYNLCPLNYLTEEKFYEFDVLFPCAKSISSLCVIQETKRGQILIRNIFLPALELLFSIKLVSMKWSRSRPYK